MRKPRNIINKDKQQEIIKDYLANILTKKEIANKYNICIPYMVDLLKRNGIKVIRRPLDLGRKYYKDESYFEQINTEEKAYFLGLLAADGSVSNRKGARTILLALTDLDLIEKFQKALKTNAPIKIKKHPIWKTQYHLSTNSIKMIQDLAQWGIVQNKYNRTIVPNIAENLIPHFIRGYFDGDGHIHIKKKNRDINVGITSSSLGVLCQMEDILKKLTILDDDRKHIRLARKNATYYRLEITRRFEILRFSNYIYKNSTIFLERKRAKFIFVEKQSLFPKKPNTTSKYHGVYWDKNKYASAITLNKKTFSLGRFTNEIDAALAYNKKAKELGLPDYMLNKIEENKSI